MSTDDWFSKQDKDCAEEYLREAKNALANLRDQNGWHESDLNAWYECAEVFQKVHRYIDQVCDKMMRSRLELSETVKDMCAEAWIGDYYCRLHALSISGPKAIEYDSHRLIHKDISNLEAEIKSYRIHHLGIWNQLQYMYDQWSEEWRNQSLKDEADELQAHMLYARMKYSLWVLAPIFLERGGQWLQKLELERRKKVSQSLIYRIENYIRRLRLVAFLLKTRGWIDRFFDGLRAWLEFLLFRISKGLLSSFLLYVIVPIIAFGLFYAWKGWVCIENAGNPITLPPQYRVWYSIFFSVMVFTGSEPGQLTSCPGNLFMYASMAVESLIAFIVIAVVIGYIINRLSSR
jgi:hypothetical protein